MYYNALEASLEVYAGHTTTPPGWVWTGEREKDQAHVIVHPHTAYNDHQDTPFWAAKTRPLEPPGAQEPAETDVTTRPQ